MRLLTLLCVAFIIPTVFSAPKKDKSRVFIVENAGGRTQIAIPTNRMSQQQKQMEEADPAQLVKKAKSEDKDEILEAISKIREMLEDSLKGNADEQLIDELVSADVLDALVDCLSKDHASRPTLVANAMAALAIIVTRKEKLVFEIQNVMDYLNYWLMNSTDDEVKKNAVSILKKIMPNLIANAKSRDIEERLEAISKIREMLEDSLKGNADEQLIDELVSADVLDALVDCLSKDHASRPTLVANAMAALAIIAPQKAKEICSANYKVVDYLKDWIKNTKDDELLKNAISILKNLLANDYFSNMDYREFSNLFNSQNKQVVEEAMWAAYHLIKRNGRIYDETKATHIQTMIEQCDDAKTFCVILGKTNDNKIINKLLRAMELVMLNPNQSAEVVKKIEDCRGSIEANDKSIAEKILKLLQKRDEISHLIMDTTNISFENIADSEAKKAMQMVVLQLQYPDRFKGFLSPQKNILLVGAQGSGKEMLAKAAANASSAKLFNIPSSVILSKKDEASVDFIKMLFQMAKNDQPSVIFIDEIDALLRRGTKRRGKAQFLVEMDRLSLKSGFGVFVIGATGRPHEMDEDASGRFAKQIFIEMPDKKAREKMLGKIVEEHKNDFELRDEEIDQLASMTENYSFGDLLALCQTANLDVLHNANEQNEFFQGAVDAQPPRIKIEDLKNAIEKVKPKTKNAQNELKKQKSKGNKRNGKEKESQNE